MEAHWTGIRDKILQEDQELSLAGQGAMTVTAAGVRESVKFPRPCRLVIILSGFAASPLSVTVTDDNCSSTRSTSIAKQCGQKQVFHIYSEALSPKPKPPASHTAQPLGV
jgi:hypothetical protein